MTKEKVIDKAIEVMGSARIANSWLKVQHPGLEGRQPEELLETEQGRYHLYEILCRIGRDQ